MDEEEETWRRGQMARLRIIGCDIAQTGFTECLIHKSSLLSLSFGALDALPTEEADRFTIVSVIIVILL